MTLPNRRQLFLYSSLFITLAINMPKLLALRKDGIMARFWHFDIWELSFQTLMTFGYCISFFYFNKDRATVLLEKARQAKARPEIAHPENSPRHSINQLIIFNLILFAAFTSFCAVIQRLFFQEPLPPLGGYGLRFLVCFLLAALELRVILLLEKSRAHEIAYEQLRSAHLQSELALLKGQLNPFSF
jgi:hypothetical protein